MDVSESIRETHCHLPAPFKTTACFPSAALLKARGTLDVQHSPVYNHNPLDDFGLKHSRAGLQGYNQHGHVLVLSYSLQHHIKKQNKTRNPQSPQHFPASRLLEFSKKPNSNQLLHYCSTFQDSSLPFSLYPT